MKLTELSYPIGIDIPVYPTNPSEKYYFESDMNNGDPANTSTALHHMHNGSHVDAPLHFSKGGPDIMSIPIDDFYYTAPYLMSIPKKKGELITLEDIKAKEEEIKKADILLLYVHYADVREDKSVFLDDFPALSREGAMYLRTSFPKLKAVAIDVISIESATAGAPNNFPVHHALLDNVDSGNAPLLVYEDINLKAYSEIRGKVLAISAFPIRWLGAEAGPVSVVAFSE